MILTDKTILKKMQKQEIKINPLPAPVQIQPHGIDLRLGNEYLAPIQETSMIDIKNGNPRYQSLNGNAIELPPQQFILATTKETITVPEDLMARVEGRSSIGRLGVDIHSTAGLIDAGFTGKITLELFNKSPNTIILYENMRVCQIIFEELDGVPKRIYGEAGNKYQGQDTVTGSMIFYDDDTDKFGE